MFTKIPINQLILNHDLVGGNFYQFKIVATNAVGDSIFSPVFTIVAAAVPDRPLAPTLVVST